MSYPFRTD